MLVGYTIWRHLLSEMASLRFNKADDYFVFYATLNLVLKTFICFNGLLYCVLDVMTLILPSSHTADFENT